MPVSRSAAKPSSLRRLLAQVLWACPLASMTAWVQSKCHLEFEFGSTTLRAERRLLANIRSNGRSHVLSPHHLAHVV